MSSGTDDTGAQGQAPETGFEDIDINSEEVSQPETKGRGRGRGYRPQAVPPYPVKDHQKILFKRHAQRHNCWIVLGRDTAGPDGGKGDLGQTNCGAIDIVVGRGSFLKEKKATTLTHPMFAGGDAARIYISERADVDRYFKLREPDHAKGWPLNLAMPAANVGIPTGPNWRDLQVLNTMGVIRSVDRSCVGISADAVRIIGQEGVKIVTKAGTQNNSHGEEIEGIPGIHLIAGDAPDSLQPMLLGKNTVDLLHELIFLQSHTIKAVRALQTVVRNTNSSVMQHTHATVGLGGGTALAPNSGTGRQLKNILDGFQKTCLEANNVMTRLNNLPAVYLQLAGERHIMSQYCKVN
tara:strand:- start:4857 stop:5909 length:1053 start_codon:yes stop_codon:yes gene_type:complete